MIIYKDSDIQFAKLNKGDVYAILLKKSKRIFDIIKEEQIIVKYNNNQIDLLCEILQDNKIKSDRQTFESYYWVMFDKNATLRFENDIPMNPPCNVYSFELFVNLINI